MRTFLTVSHTVPPSGDWGLDALSGSAGRVDLLCRNVQAALFWSHDLRPDTQVVLVFVADETRPTAVRIRGVAVNKLNPDERSTAARIRNALQARHEDPWWEEVESGIDVAPFTLAEALEDLDGTPVVLHRDGTPVASAPWPEDPVFLLGDHQPLADDELAAAGDAMRVSFGDKWLHGNHVIAIVNWMMDP